MLKDTFCSSPWFHIRINSQGNYLPCRWGSNNNISTHNISNTTIDEYLNSDIMKSLRLNLLQGHEPNICDACYYEDKHNKVSGRLRQLLKSAITVDNFEKTFCSSPHWSLFEFTNNHQGQTAYRPVDLQIDLGNTCNSACIMCIPTYSSKLATDYIKLNQLEPELFQKYSNLPNWSDDQELVSKFVSDISQNPNIKYIHFLGGETLYLKSFFEICNQLIMSGHSKNISIGTTTNCTIYNKQLEKIIKEFKHVHLGLSIESFHMVNDYIRYPSDINMIRDNIKKFIELRRQTNLHLSLRITPNILSMYHIDSVFEFMLDNKIIAESCNIIHDPSFLRIELLPNDLRQEIVTKINKLISHYELSDPNEIIVNRRRDDLVDPVINSVIFEYRNFLTTYQQPATIEEDRYKLVKFIKSFELLRNNSILNYLPEYEEFFRTYGY